MRFLVKLGSLLLILLAGGFFVFVAMLPREGRFDAAAAAQRLDGIPKSEIGIVVFTGGQARVARALDLYAEGVADRVLISGTHPQTRKVDLADSLDPSTLECCVDLGAEARSTIGNAAEAQGWAAAREYRALYLVTSDFHLPRAQVELGSADPALIIIGVPVATPDVPMANWYRSPRAWRVLGLEYLKLIAATLRTLG